RLASDRAHSAKIGQIGVVKNRAALYPCKTFFPDLALGLGQFLQGKALQQFGILHVAVTLTPEEVAPYQASRRLICLHAHKPGKRAGSNVDFSFGDEAPESGAIALPCRSVVPDTLL